MTIKKPVRPIVPVPPVQPVEEFRLGSEENFLFDMWAQEYHRIAGCPIDFWSYDVAATKKDPLYGEPTERVFRGPFRLIGHLTYPENFAEVREEGLRTTWTGTLWIARLEFEEAHCPAPSPGDVFRAWNTPYFQGDAVDDAAVPGAGYFFDITQANNDGHLFDNPHFVGFKCDFTRRTEFTPERRITNS